MNRISDSSNVTIFCRKSDFRAALILLTTVCYMMMPTVIVDPAVIFVHIMGHIKTIYHANFLSADYAITAELQNLAAALL